MFLKLISFVFVGVFAGVLFGFLRLYLYQRRLIYSPSDQSPRLNGFSRYFKSVSVKTQDGLWLSHWMSLDFSSGSESGSGSGSGSESGSGSSSGSGSVSGSSSSSGSGSGSESGSGSSSGSSSESGSGSSSESSSISDYGSGSGSGSGSGLRSRSELHLKSGVSATRFGSHLKSGSKRKPWVVLFHGNTGNIESRADKYKFLVDEGFPLLLVEYRGYGGHLGSPSESSLIQDSIGVVRWLMKNQNLGPSDIILYGESLGSCVALGVGFGIGSGGDKNKSGDSVGVGNGDIENVGDENKSEKSVGVEAAQKGSFQKIVLEGAPSSILEMGKYRFPYLPIRYLLKDTWNSLERIKDVKSSFLFIHGKKDQTVPFELGVKLYEQTAQPKKHIWIEDRGHNDKLEDSKTKQELLEFLNS